MSSNSVVLCFDRGYLSAAAVVVTSICISNPQSSYSIDLLALDLDESINDVFEFHRRVFKKEINIHHVNSEQLMGFKISGHITSATYLKIFAADLIRADRIIYVDCDLVVQTDIGVMFDFDWHENDLIAGVEDLFGKPIASRNIGLADYYLNAGVLLIKADAWRKEKVADKVRDYYNENIEKITWHDQCSINGALAGFKCKIPGKYNILMNDIITRSMDFSYFGPKFFDGIFHYNSTIKPWMKWCSPDVKALWDKYAAISPISPLEIERPRNTNESLLLAQNYESIGNDAAALQIYKSLIEAKN